MVGMISINKSYRLVTVHALSKVTVEEHVLHVELMHRPPACRSQMKDCADCRRFHHRRECLMKVDARSLREPAHDPPGFPAFQ